MSPDRLLERELLAVVATFAPGSPDPADLDPTCPLAGPGGLGFDSVRLVELLLACEERLGVTLPAETLLRDKGLTPAALATAVHDARAEATP